MCVCISVEHLFTCTCICKQYYSTSKLFLPSNCPFLGIGHVPFVKFAEAVSPPCIQWGEPVFVSADVTNLMYSVSVSGPDLPVLTKTTKDTQYCTELTPCKQYNITVTPFSTFPDYTGASNSTNDTTNGGTCTVK